MRVAAVDRKKQGGKKKVSSKAMMPQLSLILYGAWTPFRVLH